MHGDGTVPMLDHVKIERVVRERAEEQGRARGIILGPDYGSARLAWGCLINGNGFVDAIGALLHAAGVPTEALRSFESQTLRGATFVWAKWGPLLTSEYGLYHQGELAELMQASDHGLDVFIQVLYRLRNAAELRNRHGFTT